MKQRLVLLIAAMLGLGACAHAPSGPPHQTLLENAPSAAMDGQRDIVLAVANPLAPPSTHAGSNLLGYASPSTYGAGQRAVSILAALEREYGLHEVAAWPIKPLGLYCAVLEPPSGAVRSALLAALAKDQRVQLAQPLQSFSVYADNPTPKPAKARHYDDPYVDLQRGFVATDAAVAHNLSQGNGVDVAIVDTGVDTTHPDLSGRIRTVHNVVDDDTAAFNRDRHGTEVAGIIAADGNNRQGIVGMAPMALLHAYKACWYPPSSDAGATCNSFTLAKALAGIIDTPTRIINLSLGGPADPLLDKLLAQLLSEGRIVVAALPPNGDIHGFPDAVSGVIVVRTSSASAAPSGVLSAPGQDILTTQPNGGYDFTSGSSMATAHVSGIVALLLSLSPNLDAETIHDLLLRTSKVSAGLLQVNAAEAVMALRSAHKTSP